MCCVKFKKHHRKYLTVIHCIQSKYLFSCVMVYQIHLYKVTIFRKVRYFIAKYIFIVKSDDFSVLFSLVFCKFFAHVNYALLLDLIKNPLISVAFYISYVVQNIPKQTLKQYIISCF